MRMFFAAAMLLLGSNASGQVFGSPVLVNAESGAVSVVLTCRILDGVHYMTFTDFDAIGDVVQGNERFGIAFPMKDGRFTVMRFSLVGANPAVRAASRLVIDANADSTRTQVL